MNVSQPPLRPGRRARAMTPPAAPVAISVPAGAPDLSARIVAAMAPVEPALIMLFGMPAGGLGRLGRDLCQALDDAGRGDGGCRVVGCSSAGEIGPDGYAQDTVMALGFPRASFRVGLCVLRDQAQVPVSDWMGALRRLHAEFRPDLRRASFGVVLADALDALARPPLLVLGFDCILRRLALERAGMAGQMSDLLARYHVAGFNTYGEQHSGMHVNQTFVGMALMSPGPG